MALNIAAASVTLHSLQTPAPGKLLRVVFTKKLGTFIITSKIFDKDDHLVVAAKIASVAATLKASSED